MISTSEPGKCSRTAASSSAVVSTVTSSMPAGRGIVTFAADQRDVGSAPGGLLGEREAHPARGAVADEPDRVDRLARASGGHEHPKAVQ